MEWGIFVLLLLLTKKLVVKSDKIRKIYVINSQCKRQSVYDGVGEKCLLLRLSLQYTE